MEFYFHFNLTMGRSPGFGPIVCNLSLIHISKHHFTLFLGITASVCSASLVYAILLKLAEVLFAVSAQHEAGYILSLIHI